MSHNIAQEIEVTARELVNLIAEANASAQAERGKGKSASARLAALAVKAVNERCEPQVKAALAPASDDPNKRLHPWSKSKGTWSSAVGLANWLRVGNVLPLPQREQSMWLINDELVNEVTYKHLPFLADPKDSDSSVPALVRVWREHTKALAKEAANKEAERVSIYASFLENMNEEDAKRYAGEDAESLQSLVRPVPAEAARIEEIGRKHLKEFLEREEEKRIRKEASDIAAAFIRSLDDIPAEELRHAHDVLTRYLAEIASKEAAEHVKEMPSVPSAGNAEPMRKAS